MSEPFDTNEQLKLKDAARLEMEATEKRRIARLLRAEAEKSRQERENYAILQKQKEGKERLRKDRQTRLTTSMNMLQKCVTDAAPSFHLEVGKWNECTIEYDFDAPLAKFIMTFRPKV